MLILIDVQDDCIQRLIKAERPPDRHTDIQQSKNILSISKETVQGQTPSGSPSYSPSYEKRLQSVKGSSRPKFEESAPRDHAVRVTLAT